MRASMPLWLMTMSMIMMMILKILTMGQLSVTTAEPAAFVYLVDIAEDDDINNSLVDDYWDMMRDEACMVPCPNHPPNLKILMWCPCLDNKDKLSIEGEQLTNKEIDK